MNRILALVLAAGCARGNDGRTGDDGGAVDGGAAGGDDSGEIIATSGCADLDQPSALGAETCVDEAACRWTGDQSYAYFGYVLDAGGDVDGDGIADVVLGAPMWDGAVADEGRTAIIGGASLQTADASPMAQIVGEGAGDYLGSSASLVGDVDGDGLADVLTGARGHDDLINGPEAGAVYLVSSASMSAAHGQHGVELTARASWVGERSYSRLGTRVESGGDVDGDGLAELLMTGELREYNVETSQESYAAGRVYLVYGQTDGWAEAGSVADADASFDGETAKGAAGNGLCNGADLDGDGYADIALAATYGASYRGRVYVLPGGAARWEGATALSDAPIQLSGTASYDAFGWDLAAGDVTGDGVADLLVGAPLDDTAFNGAGAVFLYEGGPDFFVGLPTRAATWTGEFDDHQLGNEVEARGDLDGDGTDDILMGAVSAWQGLRTKAGRTYVVSGGQAWSPTPQSAATAGVKVHGAGVEDYVGRASRLADLDADGHDDLLVATGYTNVSGQYDVGTLYLFWGQ